MSWIVLAALDARITAALIAALVSVVVTLITVMVTPLLRWGVERDLHRRQAGYAEELETLKNEHLRTLERQRREHAHALQRAEAENRLALARQTSDAELEIARSKAVIEYEMEQRRALRTHVGAFRGRLIEVGNSLNFRIDNLRENRREIVGEESSEKWLDVRGEYRRECGDRYYFVSTVYRFMAFAAVANRFERAAIYVDPRYAEPADEQVVFYVRALRWVLTDPKLFAGVHPPYQQQYATDHFFTDDIRRMCVDMTRPDGELSEMEEVPLEPHGPLQPVLEYYDGLCARSLKWDRLMAFGLVLKAFLNTIGYEQVKSTQEWFDVTAASIHRREIRQNLVAWLPRLAIDTGEPAQRIRTAVQRADTTDGVVSMSADPAVDAAEPQA